MHGAPPVSYPVGRSAWAARLAAGVWLAGLAVTLLWFVQLGVAAGGAGWRPWLAVAVLLGCGSLLRGDLYGRVSGQLHWDGELWHWRGGPAASASPAGRLSVHLDLQVVLLLCLHDEGSGRRRWCWMERTARPERWRDLRRAVYSPAGGPASEPPRPQRRRPADRVSDTAAKP